MSHTRTITSRPPDADERPAPDTPAAPPRVRPAPRIRETGLTADEQAALRLSLGLDMPLADRPRQRQHDDAHARVIAHATRPRVVVANQREREELDRVNAAARARTFACFAPDAQREEAEPVGPDPSLPVYGGAVPPVPPGAASTSAPIADDTRAWVERQGASVKAR